MKRINLNINRKLYMLSSMYTKFHKTNGFLEIIYPVDKQKKITDRAVKIFKS